MRTSLRFAGAVVAAVALVGLGTTAGSAAPTTPPPANSSEVGALAVPDFQPSSEMSYVPITPCRIIDTRNGTGTGGTPFASGTTRTYYVSGTSGFAPQGGKSDGCGIPSGATAIAATLTAANPNPTRANGGFHAWPNGQTEPSATVLNYGDFQISAGATVTINSTTAYSLKVRNYYGISDLVVDVFGYYVKPMAGFIAEAGGPYAGSSRILGSTRTATGIYEVQFDRDIHFCSATATVYVSSYYASASTWFDTSRPDTVQVRIWTSVGNPDNQFFYIQVFC